MSTAERDQPGAGDSGASADSERIPVEVIKTASDAIISKLYVGL